MEYYKNLDNVSYSIVYNYVLTLSHFLYQSIRHPITQDTKTDAWGNVTLTEARIWQYVLLAQWAEPPMSALWTPATPAGAQNHKLMFFFHRVLDRPSSI